MSRKVFTAGEVLAAADVNSFLMDQTVMSFAGTAARGSAIGTATEGMYTHLEDTDELEFWNGSAWVSPFGLTKVATVSFSAATQVAVNNVFTSRYKNYLVLTSLSTATASPAAGMSMSLSNAGVVHPTAADYKNVGIEQVIVTPATVNGQGNNGSVASWQIGRTGVADIASATTYINNPQKTQRTSFTSTYSDGQACGMQNGYIDVTTAFDGFRLNLSSGTGIITVYGFRD
jgi:hypothetical protein